MTTQINPVQVQLAQEMVKSLGQNTSFMANLTDCQQCLMIIREKLGNLPNFSSETLSDQSMAFLLGVIGWYGPLTPLLYQPDINELMINGPDQQILVVRGGNPQSINLTLSSDWIRFICQVFRQKRALSVTLPNRFTGSLNLSPKVALRYTYVSERLAVGGDSLYIRYLPMTPFTWEQLVASGMVTDHVHQFISGLVQARVNILVSGGSGAGKTTLVGTMGRSIALHERVVSVEDEHELRLA